MLLMSLVLFPPNPCSTTKQNPLEWRVGGNGRYISQLSPQLVSSKVSRR
jgi:hypothetical protein